MREFGNYKLNSVENEEKKQEQEDCDVSFVGDELELAQRKQQGNIKFNGIAHHIESRSNTLMTVKNGQFDVLDIHNRIETWTIPCEMGSEEEIMDEQNVVREEDMFGMTPIEMAEIHDHDHENQTMGTGEFDCMIDPEITPSEENVIRGNDGNVGITAGMINLYK